jgi:hypothetical protein
MLDVTVQATIERPLPLVAAYAADPTNAVHWTTNIISAKWQGTPGVAVGSRVAFVANFLGRRLEYTYEIVEYLPGERLVMRTDEGPFPMETTYTWAPAAGGTLMSLRNRGTPTGFSRLATPLIAANVRRANREDLAALKGILEGHPVG